MSGVKLNMNSNKEIENPVLKGKYTGIFLQDQLFSVERCIETLIPWIEYVETLKDKNILIFGTGTGGTAVACAKYIGSGKVTGIDISLNEIEKSKIRAEAYNVAEKTNFLYMKSTYPLPFQDEEFDMVIIESVIEHIVDERGKYIKEAFRVLKKKGLVIISGTPNLIYPKDYHTTNLYFIPWMSSKMAYKYAVFRKKWKADENLDFAGRKGATYWQLKKWLKGIDYTLLNTIPGFTTKYLKSSSRINTFKRKFFFLPYVFTEYFLACVFRLPITSVMFYLNHLFIRKN